MTRNPEQPRVIIIGGGLVGLGTAYALLKRAPHLQLTAARQGVRLWPPPEHP